MSFRGHRFPYQLGATLYVPATHPNMAAILAGRLPPPASSIVVCLEDALHECDVERGIAALTAALRAPVSSRTQFYVRPRTLQMAMRLASLPNIGRMEGFVAPKMRPETLPPWLSIVEQAGLKIMPTLETADYYDPSRVAAMRDILSETSDQILTAVRLGGNDLLSALALRRRRGMTAYDGPLAWVLSMMSSMLISVGIPVAAPVFDIIDDLDTLKLEVDRDIEMGFISKTAIHPRQVPIIEAAMKVTQDDLDQARAIVANDARAVFQLNGLMCEPSTHRAWAMRTLCRFEQHGIVNSHCDHHTHLGQSEHPYESSTYITGVDRMNLGSSG